VLVEQRSLLGRWRELEHLLHHVRGELFPAVHAEDGLGDLLVGHLELGEQNCAVLGPTPVYHRDDLVMAASKGARAAAQVFYRTISLEWYNAIYNTQ